MSRKPSARARSRSKWTGLSSPTARAYSRIFSFPTSYSWGGYVFPLAALSTGTARQVTGALSRVAQRLRLGEGRQLAQRRLLDLARPLTGEPEELRHLVQRARLLAADPEAQLHDPAVAVGQMVQHLVQALVHQRLDRGVVGALARLVRDQVPELRGVGVVANRLVEGDQLLGRPHDHVGLDRVDPGQLGDLLDRRVAVAL